MLGTVTYTTIFQPIVDPMGEPIPLHFDIPIPLAGEAFSFFYPGKTFISDLTSQILKNWAVSPMMLGLV